MITLAFHTAGAACELALVRDDNRLCERREAMQRGQDARLPGLTEALLAEAGLLDGHVCTTFPGDIPAFRQRYPQLDVVEGVSFVAHGKAITGAGGARSYDPALFLAERLWGKRVAEGIARGLVIDWRLDDVAHREVAAATSAGAGGAPSGREAARAGPHPRQGVITTTSRGRARPAISTCGWRAFSSSGR